MRSRRVVVTGVGVCSPLGVGARHSWRRLLDGKSGISSIDKLENVESFKGIRSRVAGLIPKGKESGRFSEQKWVTSWERKTMNLSTVFALCAAYEALHDARLVGPPPSEEEPGTHGEVGNSRVLPAEVLPERIGVCLGVGMVDMVDICEQYATMATAGPKRVSPYFIPRNLINMSAAHVSMRFGLRGPNQAQSTACTTGLHSVGDATWMIQRGAADAMVAGGTEAPIYALGFAGFGQAKALSTKYNASPEEASRPFDAGRDGFVMSEGSAILVLEELSHALERGVPTIYGEVLGYGMSCDAHHLTAPSTDGSGAVNCMRAALEDAGVSTEQVGHINAHATSTPLGDAVENQAIKTLFGSHAAHLVISATKGATGHLLGAAGALEAVFTALAVHDAVAPPTLNLTDIVSEFNLNYTPLKAQSWKRQNGSRRIALTNSYGFGGTNASLCIGEYPAF